MHKASYEGVADNSFLQSSILLILQQVLFGNSDVSDATWSRSYVQFPSLFRRQRGYRFSSKSRKVNEQGGSWLWCALSRKLYSWLQWPDLLMQYITVYTPNSVHVNQITPSTLTTVSLAAFPRNLLLLLIPWRLSSGPCANLRASRSPTRRLSLHRSQAQHPKKTLPASLCTLLLGQACPNKI